jgi:Fe-S oxidoreductase
LTEAMRRIKHAVDPYQLLNPNKMYDAPPMDENLRYRPGRPPSPWPAALQFPHEAGLAGAIEQCNGQGVCRKTTGVMCPSFQATREEGNSTRGRANLLRALIREGWHATHHGGAGSTSAPQWTLQDAVFSALDLCLACKGCTSECPSGVDMPKLKYEFLNEYYKSRRRPLRDYLFGYFHVVSKWIAPAAPIYNFLVSAGWLRRLLAKAAGITDRRLLPAYATWRARPSGRANGGGQVLFLSDVFSRYLEPDVEKASFDILAALGCNVAVLSSIGAGASLLSKGLIDPARRHASKVLDEILAHPAANELCIVGCEPAEIYCLKHEYAALLPERRAEVESIAARVYLFEEFVLRHGELENLRIAKKNNSAIHKSSQYRITFHPHCHQRAEGLAGDGLPCGSSATEALLRTLGCDVDTIDAGCCGMAGSFGYDAEHYDLSMQVGELGVFPLMRAAVTREGRLAVSTGSACRIHIRQALGIEVVHPVELIQRVLVIPGPG